MMQCNSTVSYTHLDVYKRQLYKSVTVEIVYCDVTFNCVLSKTRQIDIRNNVKNADTTVSRITMKLEVFI